MRVIVGRPEKPIPAGVTPLSELARRLRAARLAAGEPSYRRLSELSHYSAATLARAAGGRQLPSLDAAMAYAAACGADAEEMRILWARAASSLRSGKRSSNAAQGGAAGPRPAQLPLDVSDFTGRAAELAALHALLGVGKSRAAGEVDRPVTGITMVISAIGGTAGIGKTALAVRFAHMVADWFPDGQLYVNLRGFGPSGPPMTPEEAMRGFLHALGVAAEAVPAGLDAEAGLYRSLLAGRRMLVLLDNAADEAQVRPLLPGSPGCLVLVTCRRQLTGLTA